ncbi:MAG: tetratricopeptide repeat protein, partial [Alphaproteobacteria bacterium]
YRAALDLFARNDLAPPLKLRQVMEGHRGRRAGAQPEDEAEGGTVHEQPGPPPPGPQSGTAVAAFNMEPDSAPVREPEMPEDGPRGTPGLSIVMLPLRNLSGEDDDYFIDGLTEEIINALSYIRWLPVVSRSTAFLYKNRTFDMRQIAGELGVAYVVEGAAIRSRDQIRINYRLIDARQGTHVWAGRIEKPLEDVFALQDEVAGQIAAMVEPRVRLAELSVSSRKPPRELAAYDWYLRSLPCIYGPAGIDVQKAEECLRKALELDPDYPPAAAMFAWLQTLKPEHLTEEERRRAVDLAHSAAQQAMHDASILALAAPVIAYFERDWNQALTLIDQATELNPNSVNAWSASGWIRTYFGDSETALAHFGRSHALSPRDPMMYIVNAGRACAYFQLGDYDSAIRHAQMSAAENPTFRTNQRIIACSQFHLGRKDAAARALERLRQVSPAETLSFVRDLLPYRSEDMTMRQVEALQALGLPDGK